MLIYAVPLAADFFSDSLSSLGWTNEKCVIVVGKFDCSVPFFNYEQVMVEVIDEDGFIFGLSWNPDDRAAGGSLHP